MLAVCGQGYVDLQIIDASGALAPCKFHLLTKDGVYLMSIPRLVDDLVMATANRCACKACDSNQGCSAAAQSDGSMLGLRQAVLRCRASTQQPCMPANPTAHAPGSAEARKASPWHARRAEVIVVCRGTVGERYYLSSGLFPNFGPT